MKYVIHTMLATTAIAWAGAGFAQGMSCTEEIRKVDEALAKTAKADSPRADEIRKLRNEAEKLQAEGKATDCLATIERAKAMLGVR